MPKCSNCSRINPSMSKFCANCGGKLPISPPSRDVITRVDEPNSYSQWAYAAFCVGGFFILMGWAAIDTADTSEDLARGTIIEDDPFSNQLNENMRNKGYAQCVTGFVILGIGAFISSINNNEEEVSLSENENWWQE